MVVRTGPDLYRLSGPRPRRAALAARGLDDCIYRELGEPPGAPWIAGPNGAIFLPAEEVAAVYEQFFGLEDEPFRLTPDPHYLYLSAKHAEALAHLRLGLTESSGFVCITGDVGTGKTTPPPPFPGQLRPGVAAPHHLH